jgi:hypothetical protein
MPRCSNRVMSSLMGLSFAALLLVASVPSSAGANDGTDNADYIVFDAASGVNTIPVAMSTTGAITGRFYAEGVPGIRGFSRTSRGTLVAFDAPGSTLTFPSAIKAAGVIAGSYIYYDINGNTRFHGFVRRIDGGFNTFDVPGAYDTFPASINGSGAISGQYMANGLYHGFLRDAGGRLVTFDAPGADPYAGGTNPIEIQDDGTILGTYVDTHSVSHGFLRSSTGFFTIFDPPGQISGALISYGPFPLSINPAGVITGVSYDANSGNFYGFIRNRDDTFITFDAGDYPPCCAWTYPFAIAPDGVITGYINDGNYVNRGFVRARDGSVTNFDAPNAGTGYGQGTFPSAITPDGKIMGWDVDSNNVGHGFVRLPGPSAKYTSGVLLGAD